MGNKLRDIRKRAKLTQEQLALKIGTTRSTIVKLERGERRLSAPWLEKLAPVLGVSQGEILGDVLPAAQPELSLHGCLMGNGVVADLPLSLQSQRIHLPMGVNSKEGLQAWVMGDSSLGQEIKEGTLLVIADPRKHFFPIVPGALLLFSKRSRVFLRKFIEGADGHTWLVPCPETPDPSYPVFKFNSGAPKYSRHNGSDVVNISDIDGAVLWEHRSRMPVSGV